MGGLPHPSPEPPPRARRRPGEGGLRSPPSPSSPRGKVFDELSLEEDEVAAPPQGVLDLDDRQAGQAIFTRPRSRPSSRMSSTTSGGATRAGRRN